MSLSSPAGAAALRAAVRHRWRAGAGKEADPLRLKGHREVDRLSGTVRGAGGVCHQRGELPAPS